MPHLDGQVGGGGLRGGRQLRHDLARAGPAVDTIIILTPPRKFEMEKGESRMN